MMITPKMLVDGKRVDAWAARTDVRVGVALLFVIFHLVMFSRAGHVRLAVPFNESPGEVPYYSNPDIGELQGYPRQPHYWSRLIVSRWDAQHYVGHAIRGSTACPKDPKTATDAQYMQCGMAWMPAYGLIANAVSNITTLPPDYVLLAMSMIAAFLLNFLWTSRTITSRMGRAEAYCALLAFNLFPSAFYIVTPYSEGACFALALGALICIANKRWIVAGALVGAATGLRTAAAGFSLGFGIAALYEIWKRWKAKDKALPWWRPLVGAALAGWGQIATMLYFQITLHEPRANLRALHAFAAFNRTPASIWKIFDARFYLEGLSAQHMDGAIIIATIALLALGVRETVARFQKNEAIFLVVATAAMLLLPMYAKADYYWGLNRYFLLAPLTFVVAGVVGRKYKALFFVWLVASLAFYWHVELCSYIAHGDPSICPCLGHVEWTAPWQS